MDPKTAIDTGLDWVNAIGAILSLFGSVGSLTVYRKLRKAQKQLRVKAALPNIGKRLKGAQKNLNATLQAKRGLSDDAAKLDGLLSDLSTKLAREDDQDLENLKREVAAILPILRASPPSTDDYRKIPTRLSTIIELLASAERDHKWSIPE